jgi:hypothetical protein
MTLKAVPADSFKEAYSVHVTLKDEKDKVILENTIDVPAGATIEQKLALPSATFGLYRLYLKAMDKKGGILGLAIGRYAVACAMPEDFQKYASLKTNMFPHGYPLEYYKKCLPVWRKLGLGGVVIDYISKFSDSCANPELVRLYKEQIDYYKSLDCVVMMRVFETFDVLTEMVALSDSDDKGIEMWRTYVKGIVQAYMGSVRTFGFLGEVNIFSIGQSDQKRFKDVKLPPPGTMIMPPDKTFRYFKAASEATKSVDHSLKVVGPSINGEALGYVRSFMSFGAGKYMDVFGMDAYRAGPDTPEAYADYIELKNILRENGFSGSAINLEQYLGITVQGYMGESESERNYYTPWKEELQYAGILARNFIQHTAAGFEWTAYYAQMQLYHPFLQEGGFPSMAGPALAASVKILNRAGEGIKITRNNDVKAFVFPSSPGGPIMVVYSPLKDMNATIAVPGIEKAWDVMGNEFKSESVTASLPLTCCPVYLKFPSGFSLEKIKELYVAADIKGAGEPFSITISISGNNKIAVTVTNRTNKPLEGRVKLTAVPEGWKADDTVKKFPAIPGGGTHAVEIQMEKMPVKNMGSYPVSVMVESGELFTGKEQTLSPLFATYMPEIKCDGDFGIWKNADWTEITPPENLVYGDNQKACDRDLKSRFATAWNNEGFGFALIVSDKDFNPPSTVKGVIMYQFDSIQLYFDQLSNSQPNQKNYDNDDVVYQVGLLNGSPTAYLEQGPEGRYLGPSNTVQGIDRDVKVKVQYQDGKIYYEAFFPWNTLKFVKPLAGETMGFSLMIHDKDGEDMCGLSLDKRSPYKNPSVWKNLILRKDLPPPKEER